MKKCSACEVEKVDEEFYTRKSGGLSSLCRSCGKTVCRQRYSSKTEEYWASNLLHKYGLTSAQYASMLASQGGKCANQACRRPPGRRRLNVDHCHKTGVVRGLLCDGCNKGLGLFQDDPSRLRGMATYLDSTIIFKP